MVNMNDVEVSVEDTAKIAKEQALKLGNDKTKLEEELKEWLSILNENSIGTDEPLVDAAGYPRTDIDVYQVRQARHRIICIRNDLKNIMKEIEERLHIIHAENANAWSETMECEISYARPIAKVTSVSANSPAEEAGLRVDDLVIKFGSICSRNFDGVVDIKNIVQHSINQFIKVVVSRNNRIVKLYLKPHAWAGPGVLGCVIVPIENIER